MFVVHFHFPSFPRDFPLNLHEADRHVANPLHAHAKALLAEIFVNRIRVDVSEDVRVGHILANVKRLVRQNPKAFKNHGHVVNLKESYAPVMLVALSVMVTFHKELSAA